MGPRGVLGGLRLGVALSLLWRASSAGHAPHAPYAPYAQYAPLTIVRHAPPAVPPYATQVNIFRWLAAFPPPVLHRALLLAQGHPHLHHPHPVVHSLHPVHHHHIPLGAPPLPPPPPPPPVLSSPVPPPLPPPPPPLVPAAKSPPPPPLGFPGLHFNFVPEPVPLAPGILPTSSFLPVPGRGLLPALPAAAPFPSPHFNPDAFLPAPPHGPLGPALGPALTPTFLSAAGFHPGPTLAPFPPAVPFDFDFGRPPSRVPSSPPQTFPPPPAEGRPSPAPVAPNNPAGLTYEDTHPDLAALRHFAGPAQFRQFLPAVNGITRATAGNLALR